MLLGLGFVLSTVFLALPLAQLACSNIEYTTLSDEFGNCLANADTGETSSAAYAMGASFDFYAQGHTVRTPDRSIRDLTPDGHTVHAVALTVGPATLNYSDLSTRVAVVRVDSVAAPTGASLVRGALARLPLHYAAARREVFARN